MRVTFIGSSVASTRGGIETTIASLAAHLAARHEVTLITGAGRRSDRPFKVSGVRVVEVPFVPRTSLASRAAFSTSQILSPYLIESLSTAIASSLSKVARNALAESDIVSTHSKYDALFFSRIAATRGIPSVFHIQGSRFGALFKALDRSTVYIAISEWAKRDLTNRFGLSIRYVVSPGIPERLLGLDRNEQEFVLFVARLQRSKGTLEAIRIFHEVSSLFPELRLVIIGDGPGRAEMEQEAQHLSIRSKVEFLGAIPHEDVLDYYAHAKLLLFPSKSEVYPLVPLEAMGAGCPVVASDVLNLTGGADGIPILLPAARQELWVTAVTRLLEKTEERVRVGNLGREWARTKTWTNASYEYERVLISTVQHYSA